MTPRYFPTEDVFDNHVVLGALTDHQTREIIETLYDAPKTTSELAGELTIPLSTLYRKLNILADASLLETTIDIRANGKNATRYAVAFDTVTVDLDSQGVNVAIERSTEPAP